MARNTEAADLPEPDRLADLPHPRENAELFGHEQAERAFLEAFRSGRLPHAWLIAGPQGVGKATLAYRIARFVLKYGAAPGLAPDTLDADPDDAVFHRIAALAHADLLVLRRPWDERTKRLKTVLSVDEIRRAPAFFSKSAGEGGWRVAIVDSADEMNLNAANALLKILEEPPRNALILIISHAPGRLLPTIRSRCRILRLKPVDDAAVARLTIRHFPEVSAQDATILARLSGGSPGRALALASQGGLDLYRELHALLKGLPKVDPKALHALGDRLNRQGAEGAYLTFMGLLDDWLMGLVRHAAGASVPETVPGDEALMTRLAREHDLERWMEVWEKIGRLVERGEAVNLSRKQIVLNAFLSLKAASGG